MARQTLGNGIFANAWIMTLVALLIYSVVLSAAAYVVIGVILVGGPLTYGLCRILVDSARGKKEVDFMAFINAFKEGYGNIVVLSLLQEIFVFLWSLLFVIPGIIKSYSYAMSVFIQQDKQNKDWQYCINKSMNMMDGYKMQLFMLDLSFIGWYIVGFLCFGVGVLFVQPYHYQARAHFYNELKKQSGDAEFFAERKVKTEERQ